MIYFFNIFLPNITNSFPKPTPTIHPFNPPDPQPGQRTDTQVNPAWTQATLGAPLDNHSKTPDH